MAEYSYEALSPEGVRQSGTIEAACLREAARKIQEQGLLVAKLKRRRLMVSIQWPQKENRMKQRMMFCRQLALMQHAGLSLADSLRVLARQTKQAGWLQGLYDRIQMGVPLAEAMEERRDVFSSEMIQLVAAGEKSGNLELVLQRMAGYIEKSYQSREKIKTAMAYPVFLLLAAGIVLCFVLYFVLPTFVTLFAGLHTMLPWPTRMLLWLSNACLQYSWEMLLFFLLLFLAMRMVYHRTACRRQVDELLLRLPLWGPLRMDIELMKVMDMLAVLWKSGIVLDEALRIVKDITGNLYLQEIFAKLQREVQKGYAMSTIMGRYDIFPPMTAELLLAGESTGELDIMLGKIAEFCRFEADMRSERLQAMLEPGMILLLGSMIGVIVLAIALPMLETITTFS